MPMVKTIVAKIICGMVSPQSQVTLLISGSTPNEFSR
jgi:hypothetical protein